MNLIDATFPYPVLNPNTDDVSFNECSFEEDVRVSSNGRSFSLKFTIKIDDPYILALIEKGDAVYSMEVTCRGTYMMRRVADKSNVLKLDLPEGSVKGNVEISLTITAVNPIENYCNPRAHEDYENQSFKIEPGEVLAFFGTEILPTDIKYPKLGSAASIIEVRPLDVEGKYTIIDLDSPIIGICLPSTEYKNYGEINQNQLYQSIFHASLVQNALLYALMEYKNYKGKDLTWVKTIEYYFNNIPELKEMVESVSGTDENGEELTISSQPILCQKIAQTILGIPNEKLLSTLVDMQESARHAQEQNEEG